MCKNNFLKNVHFVLTLFFSITLSAQSGFEVPKNWIVLEEADSHYDVSNSSLIHKTNSTIHLLKPVLPKVSSVHGEYQSDLGTANINKDMLIELDKENPLKNSYQASIKDLNIIDENTANELFSGFMDNLVSFVVDFDKNLVKINIKITYVPEWNIDNWNEFFKQKSKNYITIKN